MTAKTRGRILIVDDDQDVLLSAKMILRRVFSDVRTLSNPSELGQELSAQTPDMVLLDMNFTRGITNGEEGLFWLKKILQIDPHIQVVMSTAYGDIDLAVKAIKLGAADFVQKPWVNQKLIATLHTCLRLSESHRKLEKLQSTQLRLAEELNRSPATLIGESESFQAILSLIDKVAATDANVLITGENGTGKDVITRRLHSQSQRAQGPLICVDAGAIPPALFESEMFGHVKGAFTDARENRVGKFELAEGGSLFLDEIGNMDHNLQSKLLRALESQTITPVGGSTTIQTDIRLICATNLSLAELSNPERFRRDLLYRINTIEIRVPPLRERSADIPALVGYYRDVFAQKYQRQDVSIPHSTLKKLQAYDWPGNVRELKHAVERAIIISTSPQLTIDDFLIGSQRPVEHTSAALSLAELEKDAIRNAIQRHGGNLTLVAKTLGLGRTTLYRKMEKYELANAQS